MILGVFFVILMNVNQAITSIRHDYDNIEVFYLDKTKITDIQKAEKQISGWGNVKEVKYRSKEEAMKLLKKSWGNNAYLLDSVKENPLPRSLVITVSDVEKSDDVAKEAKKLSGIEDIKYYKDTVDKLVKFTNGIKVAAAIIMAFLILISTVVVSNTIKHGFDDIRFEFREMLKSQIVKGNNGLKKSKYVTFTVEADNLEQATSKLERLEIDILSNLKSMGVRAESLNGEERVLFLFGTGPIKGFAVTLSMGIIFNLVAVLFICRLIYDSMIGARRLHQLHFMQMLKRSHINFMGLRKLCFCISVCLVLVGLTAFVQLVRGQVRMGVDFRRRRGPGAHRAPGRRRPRRPQGPPGQKTRRRL